MFSLTAEAHAQVPYAGATFGCFGIACAPAPGVSTLAGTGLTYESSTFSGSTATSGFAAIGTNANAQGVIDVDNLGAFYLNSTLSSYSGTSFSLIVSFVLPGVGAVTTNATLTGAVSAIDNGGVFIDFNNNAQAIALAGGGILNLFIADVNVHGANGNGNCPGATLPNTFCAPITGHFTLANAGPLSNVPEPMTATLTATGLLALGLAGKWRRRRT
jgi:MYXO-CTERM domain-containing protein